MLRKLLLLLLRLLRLLSDRLSLPGLNPQNRLLFQNKCQSFPSNTNRNMNTNSNTNMNTNTKEYFLSHALQTHPTHKTDYFFRISVSLFPQIQIKIWIQIRIKIWTQIQMQVKIQILFLPGLNPQNENSRLNFFGRCKFLQI